MAVTKLSNSGIKTGNRKYDSMLAGNAAFDPAATWLIQRTTLSTASSTVTFSSIPSTYQHLQIRIFTTTTNTGNGTRLRFNSDSGSNYAGHSLRGNGTAVSGSADTFTSTTQIRLGGGTGTTYPTSYVVDIHDYASTTKNKTVRSFNGYDENGSGTVWLASGLWMSTSAISSIEIGVESSGTFASGTTFALYGFKGV